MNHAKKLLIVEGNSDKDFIENFLKLEQLDHDTQILVATPSDVSHGEITYTTVQGVIRSLEFVIKGLEQGLYTHIGIMIDTDYPQNQENIKQQRIEQIEKALAKESFFKITQPTDECGIFFQSNEYDNLLIGLWLMPNNQDHGYLETWVKHNIDANNHAHLTRVHEFIDSFETEHFKVTTLDKAKIYTWLATLGRSNQSANQKRTPKPTLNIADSLSYLDKDNPEYQNFRNWIIKTFGN